MPYDAIGAGGPLTKRVRSRSRLERRVMSRFRIPSRLRQEPQIAVDFVRLDRVEDQSQQPALIEDIRGWKMTCRSPFFGRIAMGTKTEYRGACEKHEVQQRKILARRLLRRSTRQPQAATFCQTITKAFFAAEVLRTYQIMAMIG
jgi:hypothetical protein